jgi:ketosteroid isomerase-like protein
MTEDPRLQVVRDCYDAFASADRQLIEPHLTEDFRFSSPADVDIDRATYFERCWPNAGMVASYELKRLTPVGDDEVLVTYEAEKTDGKRFRNTEIMGFDGDKLARVEVYFGWNLD